MRLPALVLLFAVAAPLETRADAKPDATSAAKAHIDKAALAHKEGRFADARNALTAAYALDPQPQLLYALGQVSVKLGKCTEAIDFYEQFLATRPARVAADSAIQAINACKVATAQQAAQQAAAAAQAEASETADTAQVPPEPALEDLDRDEAPPDLATDAGAAPVQPAGRRSLFDDPIPLVMVGGGAASLVAGGLLFMSARGTIDNAAAAQSYEEAAQLDEDARGQRLLSVAFTVAGAGLLGGGIYYYLRTQRAPERRSVTIIPTSAGGVVSWSGRF
jgi:tetratricopeptide (TPR) repeat protein